jgi:chemotaxis protein methyltransferase CheR
VRDAECVELLRRALPRLGLRGGRCAAASRGAWPELCLRPEFREGVEFRHEDLRCTMRDGPFHLVLCRNVAFTYLDLDGQRAVPAGIAARLVRGGFLVVGARESLPEPASGFERSAGSLPISRRA